MKQRKLKTSTLRYGVQVAIIHLLETDRIQQSVLHDAELAGLNEIQINGWLNIKRSNDRERRKWRAILFGCKRELLRRQKMVGYIS